jgi:hypothetical protein
MYVDGSVPASSSLLAPHLAEQDLSPIKHLQVWLLLPSPPPGLRFFKESEEVLGLFQVLGTIGLGRGICW